jgi:hypothetical protein
VWATRCLTRRSRSPVNGDGPDTIETGPGRAALQRWQLAGIVVVFIVGAFVGGVRLGYVTGNHRADARVSTNKPIGAASTSPGPNTDVQPTAVSEPGNKCSSQVGHDLQLGVEIANRSSTMLTLHGLQPVLPLGGLRATSATVGSCGQLSVPPSPVDGATLPAGATLWLTVTFAVLLTCPGALPVQFDLSYTQNGALATVHLTGFSDLGQVPYSECPTSSS